MPRSRSRAEIARAGVRHAPKRCRTKGVIAAAVGAWFEGLESRMLLSGVAPASGLVGPVSSPAAAEWYRQRVAAIDALPASHTATPFYQIDQPSGGTAQHQTSKPVPPGLSPTQLETYYNFGSLHFGSTPANGAGQTIALIDAYDDPDIARDLATFDAAYKLPAPPSFLKVSQTGSTTDLPSASVPDPINGSWALEETLDVEWAHALAPAANILLVECNSPTDKDLDTGIAYAAAAPGVSEVSMSFGLTEAAYNAAELAVVNAVFVTPPGHQGVTFLASSGDDGAFDSQGPVAVSSPASSPSVLAVGGTTILVNSHGNPTGESAWTGSGGGVSVLEAQPAAQQVVGIYPGRAVPDVSFDADPNSGVNVVDSLDFGKVTPWQIVGGTSLASPSWGAILAIANQGRIAQGLTTLDGSSQTIPDLYATYLNGNYSSDFHDITTGNNGYYGATIGYDRVTGLGSPNVGNLVNQLISSSVATTPPAIGSFAISPMVEDAGTPITLTASNVTDAIGVATSVSFYRTSSKISTFLGMAVPTPAGNWSLTVSTQGLAIGTYTYTAIAANGSAHPQNSPAVSATNKVVINQATPTIASFAIAPKTLTAGGKIKLTATGVSDKTSTIVAVTFYLTQSDGSLKLVGNGKNMGSGMWIFDGATASTLPGLYTYVAIATAASGLVSAPATAKAAVPIGPATTVVVNTPLDLSDPTGSQTVSLRDAVAMANAADGPVTIKFDPSVFTGPTVIHLIGPTLQFSNTAITTTLDGPAAPLLTVSGSDLVEVFNIAPHVTADISNLTITGGLPMNGEGGGIYNAGTATLNGVTVSGNFASHNGGGIENMGTLSLINSTITGNTASGTGGGINNSGTLTLDNTAVAQNSAVGAGGAINNNGKLLIIDNSSLSNNTTDGTGGGLNNSSTASATIQDSTLSGNVSAGAGGGIFNAGKVSTYYCAIYANASNYSGGGGGIYSKADMTLVDTTISGNAAQTFGGGVENVGSKHHAGELTLDQCSLYGNSAFYGGGGVSNSGDITINASTISGNTAGATGSPAPGGGIQASSYFGNAVTTIEDSTVTGNTTSGNGGGVFDAGSKLTVSDSTIARNTAYYYGGIDNVSGTTGPAVTIANSIVANDTVTGSSTKGVDYEGVVNSLGYNLIGQINSHSGWTSTDLTGTNAKPIDADLSPLGYFGGPTETLVPLAGSPALRAGSVSLIPAGITTDQRGFDRTVNGHVDIGAFETQGISSVKLAIAGNQKASVGQASLFALGSFTDVNSEGPYTIDIDWGDDSLDSQVSMDAAGAIPKQTHTFDTKGTFIVSIFVTDSNGDVSAPAKLKITVG